jgi:hypothetical protein
LRSANGVEVFVDHLVGGRRTRRLPQDIVGFVGQRRAIVDGHVRGRLRPVVAVVTRHTCHAARAAEVGLVDGVHHRDHLARHLFLIRIFRVLVPPAAAFADMAVCAVDGKRIGDEPHRPEKLVGGHAFQNLNVLEHLFGRWRFLGRRRLACYETDRRKQQRRRRSEHANDRTAESELHGESPEK